MLGGSLPGKGASGIEGGGDGLCGMVSAVRFAVGRERGVGNPEECSGFGGGRGGPGSDVKLGGESG